MSDFDYKKYLKDGRLLKEEIKSTLKRGGKYSVLEPGMNEWQDDLEFIGYDSNEQEYVFIDSTNIAPGSNEVYFLKVSENNIETDVKSNQNEPKPQTLDLDESKESLTEGSIKGIGLKELESTENLRDYLQGGGHTIKYKEPKRMFGKDYPSTVSIFTAKSTPSDSLGSQYYIELFVKDSDLYMYGFRSINGEVINKKWFDGALRDETSQAGFDSSHYFGTEGKGIAISPFGVEDILDEIASETYKERQRFADFYKDWKNPD